jgi:hypothetical protein
VTNRTERAQGWRRPPTSRYAATAVLTVRLSAATALAFLALGASPAAALDGWSFGGSTSQRYGGTPYPFSYDALLGRARVAMSLRCTDGGVREPIVSIDATDLPRSGPGVFVTPLPEGRTRVLEMWMTRQQRRSSLRGRVRVRQRIRQGSTVVESCDSGFVSYTADENAFGGDSSPPSVGGPLAVSARVASGGRRLTDVLVPWATRDCAIAGGGTGFLAAPTRVPSVAVDRRGRFRTSGSYRVTSRSGNTLVVRYTLAGAVSALRTEGRARELLGGVFDVSADLVERNGRFRIRNCRADTILFEAER